jgi:TonB-dependent receptor
VLVRAVLVASLVVLVPAVHAAPSSRGYEGPAAVSEEDPPVVETPVTPTPTSPPPPKPVEAPPPGDDGGDDAGDGFEVVDLTEDPEALRKELAVETVAVKGESGTVRGRVRDGNSGQPLIGAYVEAIGTPYKTKTDLSGEYTLPLPPGNYEIRIRADANEPRRVSGVKVTAGSDQTINGELRPLAGSAQVVKVTAEMNRESEGARLQQRKRSAATRDILSRDEIRKSGGGSTSMVAARIVGATVIDGKYLFVRGLGHRYGNTLFDGARVPSPEPELRTIPLDIFPATALSAINVQKTFTPDMPGDFAGASIQLESRELPKPRETVAELYAEVGANTRASFQDKVHNGGFGGYDAFALGNVPRRVPDGLPSDAAVDPTALDEDLTGPRYTAQEIERYGESFITDTRVRRGRIAPPNFGLRATVGRGFGLRGDSKISFLTVAQYRHATQTLRRTVRQYGAPDDSGNLPVQVGLGSFETTNSAQWSTVGLLRFDADKHNRLHGLVFYSRDADDETRELRGVINTVTAAPAINTRLRYVMRSILLTRLGGKHKLPRAKDLTIDWFGAFGQARRSDPSMRDMLFTDVDSDGVYRFDTGNDTGKQLFLELRDNTESGAVDFTLPFEQWGQLESKFKFGAWVEGKQREFFVRRFTFQPTDTFIDTGIPVGTGNIIDDSTIGPEGFRLIENTVEFDNYRARQEVYAGYVMLDLPFVRWFRTVSGVRFEANEMHVTPYDLFTGQDVGELDSGRPARARLRDRDFLPSLGFIFSPTDAMNVRLTGTRTVARPEFRELAPFVFTDFVGAADVLGNPAVRSGTIWNADLRWEWFPSGAEVVAVSGFYKRFDDPIEQVVRPRSSSQLLSYRNAEHADLVGAEVELRKNLEFISKRLKAFSIGFNAAYSYSRVELGELCDPVLDDACDPNAQDVSTSRQRPLQGQSPFVANAYVEFDRKPSGTTVRVMYNAVLRKIAYVGGLGLPDIYEQPIHQLDVNVSQRLYEGLSLRLGGTNLLDWQRRFVQGGQTWRSYRVGTMLTVGLAYDFG